jgi:hypothetical protein
MKEKEEEETFHAIEDLVFTIYRTIVNLQPANFYGQVFGVFVRQV